MDLSSLKTLKAQIKHLTVLHPIGSGYQIGLAALGPRGGGFAGLDRSKALADLAHVIIETLAVKHLDHQVSARPQHFGLQAPGPVLPGTWTVADQRAVTTDIGGHIRQYKVCTLAAPSASRTACRVVSSRKVALDVDQRRQSASIGSRSTAMTRPCAPNLRGGKLAPAARRGPEVDARTNRGAAAAPGPGSPSA